MAALVDVRDLTVAWPAGTDTADRGPLRGVTLRIGPGEVVGVIGGPGSGASTLAGCLNGIVPALVRADRGGTVRVVELDPAVTGVADMARHVATVLDDPEAQVTQRSVLDEVAFALENLGVAVADVDGRATEALARVGLAGFERRDPLTLSGGEQQRLAVACAIAMRPRLLVMDAPTANLDGRAARGLLELARALAGGPERAAVVVVSEDLELLAEVVTRIVSLEDGRIVGDGPPEQVFSARARATPARGVPVVTALAARLDPDAGVLPVTMDGFTTWLAGRG